MTSRGGRGVGAVGAAMALGIASVVACSSSTSSPAATDGGPAADAAIDVAADSSSVAACTAGFGAPVALSEDLVGRLVVLRGILSKQSNEVIALPANSQCTDTSRAIVLTTPEQPDEPVQMVDGMDVYCGCADNASAGCDRFALGPTVLVKGTLTRVETGECNQTPCYHLAFEASCLE